MGEREDAPRKALLLSRSSTGCGEAMLKHTVWQQVTCSIPRADHPDPASAGSRQRGEVSVLLPVSPGTASLLWGSHPSGLPRPERIPSGAGRCAAERSPKQRHGPAAQSPCEKSTPLGVLQVWLACRVQTPKTVRAVSHAGAGHNASRKGRRVSPRREVFRAPSQLPRVPSVQVSGDTAVRTGTPLLATCFWLFLTSVPVSPG